MKRVNVVYSLITDSTQSKVLMVLNKDNGQWTLPGGAVEEDETLEIAAIREAKEETGLDIEVFGIVAVNEAVIEKYDDHVLFMTFRAAIIGGSEQIVRPDEIVDIQWIDLEQSDRLMPFYKEGISGIVRNHTEITYFDEGRI